MGKGDLAAIFVGTETKADAKNEPVCSEDLAEYMDSLESVFSS